MSANSNRKIIRWLSALVSSLILLSLVGGPLLGAGCQGSRPQSEALVRWVIDGDTLVLESSARVRLLGIDAPEMGKDGGPSEFMAAESREALIGLTRDQPLRLEYDAHRYDRYGRVLAYVFTPEGLNINVDLVRRGLARVYFHPPNWRFKGELLAAQKEALEARRGIWSRPLKQDEPFYLANRSTFRIHRPNCPLAKDIAPHNRVKMPSLKEAYLEGYSPCRSCKP